MSSHRITSPVTYVLVFGALLLLTLTTYLLSGAHLGAWEVPVALGIASVKSVLVVLFFMHLLHASRLIWLAVASAILFLGIMLVATMSDYLTRGWIDEGAVPQATAASPLERVVD